MRSLSTFCLLAASGVAFASPADDFWRELSSLCGNSYAGQVVQEPAGDDGFAGKRLVMHVRDCGADRIRVPFVVGEDLSRTWVLTRRGDRIELKHDHRHADGTPEEVTMYGGTTANAGRADPDALYTVWGGANDLFAAVADPANGQAIIGCLLFHTLFVVAQDAGTVMFGNPVVGEYFRVFLCYGVIAVALVMHTWRSHTAKKKMSALQA